MSPTPPPVVCRSPWPDEWIQVKPEPESRFSTLVLTDPSSAELHLVVGQFWPRLADSLTMFCPRPCANHTGEMFVWPVPASNPDCGSVAPWRETAGVLAGFAEKRWCRVVADEASAQYVVSALGGGSVPPPPTWPVDDFLDALYSVSQGRIILSENHPLVVNGG